MNLSEVIPENQVLDQLIFRLAYARDASVYRLIPKAVVRPKSEQEILSLIKYASENDQSLTFRTAGTSLSGQAVTNGIIVETILGWQNYNIQNSGASIMLSPGLIGAHANRVLAPYNRKIGPDPASIESAMIGGIIANNASGMCCGVINNSYNTMKSIRFILSNGNIYDTSDKSDYDKFVKVETLIASELKSIREQVIDNLTIKNLIRDKYKRKNTSGYSLNALLDFEHPLDILAHLMIGSEGTLGFISNITLNTVHDPQCKSTGLLFFPSIQSACDIIPDLKKIGAASVELMDYASLATVTNIKDQPYALDDVSKDTIALLVEFQEMEDANLIDQTKLASQILKNSAGILYTNFTSNEKMRSALWKIRKSLYPTVGSMRKPGTSVITEDLCFELEQLPDSITGLHDIFKKTGFSDAVIFGHAKDGNLHFVTSADLESHAGIDSYYNMMDCIVDLTLKHNGTLKAEHGTGRNMAPYIEKEWGKEVYRLMWRIKECVDPDSIFNPGVILNKDKSIPVNQLKTMPVIDATIDLCVECGYCESICPSKNITLTPRQRIAVAREINGKNLDSNAMRLLIDQFKYYSDETCATDGLCEINCPVNINTGTYIKQIRFVNRGFLSNKIADWTVKYFSATISLLRFFIKILNFKSRLFGRRLESLLKSINKITGHRLPAWNRSVPRVAARINPRSNEQNFQFIYYPSCINRVFGQGNSVESLIDIMHKITRLTNQSFKIPENISDLCCGMPYESKGFRRQNVQMLTKTIESLYNVSNCGKYPIVVDTSPCTFQLLSRPNDLSEVTYKKWDSLKFIDIVQYLNGVVKDRQFEPLKRSVAIHSTCSSIKMNDSELLIKIAKKCADSVLIPSDLECCGFAGDRGLLIPDLTEAATKNMADEIKQNNGFEFGYSSSTTCEIGMSSATGIQYLSIASLVRDYLVKNSTQ